MGTQESPVTGHIWPLIKISIALWLASLLYKVAIKVIFTYRIRNRFYDIPSFPRDKWFGNLINIGRRLSPEINAHPDFAFEDMWRELGQPPAYMIDMAPIDRGMLVIADPNMAEVLAQPSADYRNSMPKADTLQGLTTLIGEQGLVLLEGEEWKALRRRFNKGFAPSHLNTLIPLIVSKTTIFLDQLKDYAKSGDDFPLGMPATDLTTDIITEMTIEKSYHAQTTEEGHDEKSTFGLLTSIRIMSSLTYKVGQGIDFKFYTYPFRRLKELLYQRLYTRAIRKEIQDKLPWANQESQGKEGPSTGKAIVHLALNGVDLTPSVMNSTISSVKTFLFAGQDTTSTTIQWMAYELSKSYPSSPLYNETSRKIREQLCAEHDAVFGTDPFGALDVLRDSKSNADEILNARLPYTTAFVKEALRLHPPGGSARLVPLAPYDPGVPTRVAVPKPCFMDMPAWRHSRTGEMNEAQRVRVDGLRLYNIHWLIHRNPATWGPDVLDFDPSRFLEKNSSTPEPDANDDRTANGRTQDNTSDLPHPYHISTLPVGSYRPFERGPRNCIGSHLAYLEAKTVLCAIARGFEFIKVGLDGTRPKPGEVIYGGTGQEDEALGDRLNWKVWSINNVTAVPVDGMRMRLKPRKTEK